MEILVVGDVHGDADWFETVVQAAVDRNIGTILQVGDFGYWEHTDKGKKFLDFCSDVLAKAGIDCVWVDGNHENHPVLRANYGPGGNRHRPTYQGFWTIRERLYYAPRGHRWAWCGVRFLALGGAYSVDINWRRPGTSWWPEETITDEEARLCIDGGPADIMVCHDAPWGASNVLGPETAGDKDNYPVSAANRRRLAEVVKAVRPQLLVHGHYHHRNSTHLDIPYEADGRLEWHRVRIEGLGRDWDYRGATLVLDTKDYLPKESVDAHE